MNVADLLAPRGDLAVFAGTLDKTFEPCVETFLFGRGRELCDAMREEMIKNGHDADIASRAVAALYRQCHFEARNRVLLRQRRDMDIINGLGRGGEGGSSV